VCSDRAHAPVRAHTLFEGRIMGEIHSWAERRDALIGLEAARKSGLSDAQVRRRAKGERYRRVRRTV
jgi:hypothetical protein